MYPNLIWTKEGDKQRLLMEDRTIFELKKERWFRFRPAGRDLRWAGSDFEMIDPGWGFYDPYLDGYVPDSVNYTNDPENGCFVISLKGHKPTFDGSVTLDLKGTWLEADGVFEYEIDTSFSSKLEDLYQNSLRCQKGYAEDPAAPTVMEIIDIFFHYSCYHNFNQSNESEAPRPLYQWMIMSENGQEWVKAPRLHMPDVHEFNEADKKYLGEENSLTCFPVQFGGNNSYMGMVDKEFGGWLMQPLEAPAPIRYVICWYAYDIHMQSPHAVPPRFSCERVDLHYRCRFTPITAQKGAELVAKAREYDWRTQPRYDIPPMEYESHFDRSLLDFGVEEMSFANFWQTTGPQCRMDREVGCAAPGSVRIIRTEEDSPIPSAWYTVNWGIPYDKTQIIGRRYRFSAMIKCENVTGKARLAMASTVGIGGCVFYGHGTHHPDGEPCYYGGTLGGHDEEGGKRDIRWIFSPSVRGTTDWTPVSVEFDVYGVTNAVIMEMSGSGKCWFDDVKLEDVGPARWEDVATPEKHFTQGLERYWERYKTEGLY